MEQVIQFLMDNLFIVLLVVFGILGNLGQGSAAKKRKQERAKRLEQQRQRQAQGGGGATQQEPRSPAPTGGPATQRERGEDDLARRIREMLEGGKPQPQARTQAPPKPKPVPPPVVQRTERASDAAPLAEGFDIAFDSEKTVAELAEEKRVRDGGRPRPKIVKPVESFESSIGSEFLDYTALDRGIGEDPFGAGSFGVDSSIAIDLAAENANRSTGAALPEGIRPRSAFEMMIALGPCRALKDWDDEERRF